MVRLLEGGPSARGWSQQVTIEVCPQRWAFSQLLRLRGAPSPALVRGSLVHTGLHHLWQARIDRANGTPIDYADPIEAIRMEAAQQDREAHAAGEIPTWGDHVPLCVKAMQRYIDLDPHRHLTPIAAELQQVMWFADGAIVPPPPDAAERFALAQRRDLEGIRAFYAAGAPWASTFRLDLLVAHGGKAVVIDWKTAWKVDTVKERGFILSGQMLQYELWGRVNYGPLGQWGGVAIGFANLAKVEDGKKDPFSIYPVPAAPAALDRFGQSVCDRAERIAELLQKGRAFDNYPRAFSEQGPCQDRYSTCDFVRPCREGV